MKAKTRQTLDDSIERKTIALALRKARQKLGESQARFATRIGVDQATISRWEEYGPTTTPSKIALRQILAGISRD